MADLSTLPRSCCAPQAQARCCEPSGKAACCGTAAAGGTCGCCAGAQSADVRSAGTAGA